MFFLLTFQFIIAKKYQFNYFIYFISGLGQNATVHVGYKIMF